MPYPIFDRSKLNLLPLSERIHDLTLDVMMSLNGPFPDYQNKNLDILADRMVQARERGAAVIVLMGAHVIRSGVSRMLIDLMARGVITLIGGNGAVAIHDMEFAMIGKTTESVAKYIREGQFGLWHETGRVNDAANFAYQNGYGLGESIGKMIADSPEEFPYAEISVLAAGYRLGVPVTLHVSIGQDIVHEHPNFDAAALGAASYRDFLTLAQQVDNLEGGVMLNIGTAVMGPEVYLKTLAMARNVAHQEGREIKNFTTGVFDIVDIGEELEKEAPKTEPRYYFRPFKTILVRTVADGGESYYVRGLHRETVSNLYRLVIKKVKEQAQP
jgi:hypothetical protein